MSEAQESAVLTEVTDFIRRRRQDYISLLTMVSEELRRFKDRPDFQNVIYRIYSRADKQIGGDPLKADWKIAKKLTDKRGEYPSTSTTVTSIHDIIGVTVVTYFTSQIDMVVDAIKTKEALGNLIISNPPTPKSNGYHAVHLVFASSKPALMGLLCEVQVKSVLHDGWATKTHDLTYKPSSSVNPEHSTQIKILGDSIDLIESQSDIIRKFIEHERIRDGNRRAAAQLELLAKLTEDHEHTDQVQELATWFRETLQRSGSAAQPSEVLSNHFNFWRQVVERDGHSEFSCRFITLLASVPAASDLNNLALDAIEAWIGSKTEGEDKVRALGSRALANYTFARFTDAVRYQEVALEYASRNSLPVHERKNTLAYFIAEDFYHNPDKHEAEEKFARAKKLISEAEPDYPGDERSIIMDTQGAVAIAFGNEAEIRDGLRLCQQALDLAAPGSPDRAVAEAYYRLHEQRACRRLLGWE